MLLDELALLVRQGPRLGENRLGNSDLPDVVEQRAQFQPLERARIEAEPLADLQREVGDPTRV